MATLAEELRQPTQRRALAVTRTMRALFGGRFQEAENLVQEALRAGPGAEGLPRAGSGWCESRPGRSRGNGVGSRSCGPTSNGWSTSTPRSLTSTRFLASLYSEVGLEADAREKFEALARHDFADLPFDSDRLFQMSLLSQVCTLLGDRQRAAKLYDLLLPYAGCNVLAYPELSLGSTSQYLGLLASALSRWAEAERHFDAAIDMHTEMGARPWLSHTQHDYARMLPARDGPTDRERALGLIAEALTTYWSWEWKAGRKRPRGWSECYGALRRQGQGPTASTGPRRRRRGVLRCGHSLG
jgi:tetratricopeptide (TPR) repeat protein